MTNNTSILQVLDSCTFWESHNDPYTYKEPIKYSLRFRTSELNHMYLKVDCVSCYCSTQKTKRNLSGGSLQNQITATTIKTN